jgi:UDP-N-acetylmuramoylalanine--D-glutamate ligase
MKQIKGKHVLVVGLARSGRAVALCLHRRGAVVTVTDLKPPGHFQDVLPELLAAKIGLELGSQREETFLRQDLVVVSPGVPWDLPQLEAARRRNIPVVSEVEVAGWYLRGTLLGVTGSNGKTTTTTLLGDMLKTSGYATFVGGNVGVPLSWAVDQTPAPAMLVTELSSFQLEGIQELHPHVALLLNLSPNHLDRHPDFATYARAKAQIFRNQTAVDYAILNADDSEVMKLTANIASRKVLFSCRQALPEGVMVADGQVLYRVGYLERPLFEARELRLRGEFNLENALAAAAAACAVGADFDAVRQAVRAFRGVEHRLEHVATIRGVEFFNNSKATSVDATVKSLGAFERGVHLIMGGKDKGAPYAPLRPLLKDRVRYIYLIGAAAGRISEELAGVAELIPAGELETAVREAFHRAAPGDVVLLAPACSSFDQFEDFEHRGRVFKELVHRLEQQAPATMPAERRKPSALPKRAVLLREAAEADVQPLMKLVPTAKPEPVVLLPTGPAKAEPETAPAPQPVPGPKTEPVSETAPAAELELKVAPELELKAELEGPPVLETPAGVALRPPAPVEPEVPKAEVTAEAEPEAALETAPLEAPSEEAGKEAGQELQEQVLAEEPPAGGEAGVEEEGASALPKELPSGEEGKSLTGEETPPAVPEAVEAPVELMEHVAAPPVRYPDFISVYEVAAEERAATTARPFVSEAEPAGVSAEVPHSTEVVNDELIPFEVREAAADYGTDTQAAEAAHPESASPLQGPKQKAPRGAAADQGEAADESSDRQGRLPGF